ncbi:hypothetical protein ACFOZ7_10825 [Natribaculum luteum]|uniref:DUF7974 domain-containing protein n=1 Tax=Natribaculum luteum TaxID=1586232 RepID=A0ABD5P0B6_9EURY|nr:hypothetical protein [Natribaculum luteum]
MRRIYESDALSRDDEDPFSPSESDERSRKMIDWEAASHAFLPVWLRDRAVSVDLETNKDEYEPGEPVRWRATFRNRLPFPVRIVTETPELWRWSVDGVDRASEVPARIPDRKSVINFSRGERKVVERRWKPQIQVTEREWEPLESGEHTLSVALNVDRPDERDLVSETSFTITS